MATKSQAQRWATLGLALMALMLSLSACQTPLDGTASAHIEAVVVSTGVAGSSSSSSTPSIPPFTIGVWTSNSSPQARDTVIVYVLCMLQDSQTGGPSGPASGVQLRIHVHAPIDRTYSGTTAADGTAAVQVKFDDKGPGAPVAVDVTATWQGNTYQSQTYFTPAPQGTLTPTATPSDASATPNPNGDPSLISSTPTTAAAPPTPTPVPPAPPTPTSPPEPTPTDPVAP